MNHNLSQQYLRALGIQGWQLKKALNVVHYSGTQLACENEGNELVPDQSLAAQELIHKHHDTDVELANLAIDNIVVEKKISTEEKSDLEAKPERQDIQYLEIKTTEIESKTIDDSFPDTNELDSILVQSILSCHQCTARTGRHNALVGQGNKNASIFIICDAPGAEEDLAGHYLTEQTQSLFQAMWKSIGADKDYYLTGIIKCYSMENYLVDESELNNCANFLYAQLEQVKPDLIVVFGAAQAQAILKTSQSFNELRDKIHKVTLNQIEYSLVVTYHPAYLLRNPLFKKQAMADLLRIKSVQI